MSNDQPVPHDLTLLLPAGEQLVGLISLRLVPGVPPMAPMVNAVGHRLDGRELPPNTPNLLRKLADELEIERFLEGLNDVAAS